MTYGLLSNPTLVKTLSWGVVSCIPINLVYADEFYEQSGQHAPSPTSSAISAQSHNLHQEASEDDELDLIWAGVSSSFSFPMNELEEQENWLQGLSGNIGFNLPIDQSDAANIPSGSTNGPTNYNTTATLSLKYTIAGSWFVSTSFYHYLDKDQKQDWNPDFTYVFGYSDWRPYTFSLVYSNYGGNRFSPSDGGNRTEFNQGTWALGWKFPITSPFKEWLSFTEDGAIGCQVDFNLTPEYFDLESISYLQNQKTLSLGCKYSIYGNWYINGTGFYYFDREHRQPWNPDFTYGFGYFDWRPGTITLQYNNYSGNRWNPSHRPSDTGHVKNGSITLAYSFTF
ncbi:hypothetical protein L4C33_11670 [Vibrio makurazakiensis]|uniref:hypothetical protein n=1 Tax=Vibrio makurazakiensis TaxID=2910250 RepID=UPI003D11897E